MSLVTILPSVMGRMIILAVSREEFFSLKGNTITSKIEILEVYYVTGYVCTDLSLARKAVFRTLSQANTERKKTLHIRSYYQNCFSLSGMRVFLFGLPFSGLVDITIYTPTTLNMFSYLVVVGSLDGGG